MKKIPFGLHGSRAYIEIFLRFNPSTAGAAYIRVFIFYQHNEYQILNMLKIKWDINQPDLKRADLNFVKSE